MKTILISGIPWNTVTTTRGLSQPIPAWTPISREAWGYGEDIVSVIIKWS
jgi:hypothetical protein